MKLNTGLLQKIQAQNYTFESCWITWITPFHKTPYLSWEVIHLQQNVVQFSNGEFGGKLKYKIVVLNYCGLDDCGFIPSWVKVFSVLLLCNHFQTGSGAHPASNLVCTCGFSFCVKWLGYDADHSPLSSAKNRSVWSYISMPCMPS